MTHLQALSDSLEKENGAPLEFSWDVLPAVLTVVELLVMLGSPMFSAICRRVSIRSENTDNLLTGEKKWVKVVD